MVSWNHLERTGTMIIEDVKWQICVPFENVTHFGDEDSVKSNPDMKWTSRLPKLKKYLLDHYITESICGTSLKFRQRIPSLNLFAEAAMLAHFLKNSVAQWAT